MATAATLVSVLSACSNDGPEREYAIPATLCGTAIDSDDLAPFLPAGKDISVKGDSRSGIKDCEVVIDNVLVVTTTQAWLEDGRTTAYFASGKTLDTPTHSANGGRFQYSGREAFGKTRNCIDAKYRQELYTAVQAQGSKHTDADAMKRLIISYTSEVETSAECTGGAQ
ncbi:hypothetical protein ABT147_19120 [Streptomyces sp. NPDC001868]|uniref:hypothetical protein n=1 Tax=Streptomyces sp. NPDC001868 TaxID=3154401 RepID=UPI0033276AC2